MKQTMKGASKGEAKAGIMELRLYIAGQTPKSLAALSNLRNLCRDHLHGKYQLEIIDLIKNPQMAEGHQIIAIPTLVRQVPEPVRRIIGDLSNPERVLLNLGIKGTVQGAQ